MKRTTILFTLLSLLIGQVYAQDADVNLYTGRPNVSVPIWTVTSKDLAHPISLGYSGGGVKVDAVAGKAGIGWHLNAGGLITREMRGLPDEYDQYTADSSRRGWIQSSSHSIVGSLNFSSDTDFSNSTDEGSDFTVLNINNLFGDHMIDSEPDLFHINTMGLSFTFLFDNNGDVVTIPYQDVEIGYGLDLDGKIDSIAVIDSRGIRYNFELPINSGIKSHNIDSTDNYLYARDQVLYKDSVNYHSIWHLTAIESPAGGKINFSYHDETRYESRFDESGYYYVSVPESSTDSVTYYVYDSLDVYRTDTLHTYKVTNARPLDLRSIFTEDISVSFEDALEYLPVQIIPKAEADYHKDITVLTPRPLLNKIQVSGQGGLDLDRRFILRYGYTKNFEDQSYGQTHPFLRSITEHISSLPLPPYKFEYVGVNFEANLAQLPKPNSNRKDFFGFFNNKTSLGSNPDLLKLYVYPDLDNANRYRFWPMANYTGPVHVLTGRDGVLNEHTVANGSLSKIQMPSGGNITYYYEPNYFHDSQASYDRYGGGIRVKKVVRNDGIDFDNDIIKYYSYSNSSGNSSGKLLYRPQYAMTRTYFWERDSAALETYAEMVNAGIEDNILWQKISVRSENDLNQQNGPTVGYEKVSVSQSGNGRVEYDFQIFEDFAGSNVVTSTRIARELPVTGTLTSNTFAPITNSNAYPFAPANNIGYKRGLLDKVSIYSQNDFLLEETQNHYSFLPQVDTVVALKVEKFPYLREVIDGATTTTNVEDAFVFSQYLISTSMSPVVDTVINTKYNENSVGTSITSTSINEFDTTGTKLTLVKSVSSNGLGNDYITEYKYSKDYSIDTAKTLDDHLIALAKMQERGLNYTPVETISKVNLANAGERVVGSGINLYKYQSNDKFSLVETKTLRASANGINDYTSANVVDTLNEQSFMYDSRMETVLVNETFDTENKVLSSRDRAGNYVATLFNTSQKVVSASVAGAKYSEVLFIDFENKNISSESHEFEFDDTVITNNDLLASGRYGGKSYDMKPGNSYRLFKDNMDLADERYVFSFWAKDHTTAASGNILVILTLTGSSTIVDTTIVDSTEDWVYYESIIDASALTGDTDITITTDKNIRVDDVLFRPFSATVKHSLFNSKRQLISETSSGKSVSYGYDDFGRVAWTKDFNGNLISVNEYSIKYDDPEIYIDQTNYNFHANFKAYPEDLVNPSYYWVVLENIDNDSPYDPTTYDFSGVSPGASGFSYTFPDNEQVHMVYLKITATGISDQYAKLQVRSESLTAAYEPVNICVSGPVIIDLCGVQNTFGTCNFPMQMTNGINFQVNLPDVGAASTEFTWERCPESLYDKGDFISTLIERTDIVDDNEYNIQEGEYGSESFYVWCTIVALDANDEPIERYRTNDQKIHIYSSQTSCDPAE